MFKDSPITYRTLLRSRKLELDQEDGWLLANLISLPIMPPNDPTTLAQRLLDLCANHRDLKLIKRISIVGRTGGANRLYVISSANLKSIGENLMPESYSCFVNPNGSLFSLHPRSVRFFTNARDVVAQFIDCGAPVQRSLTRVAQMNLGAGICSGIFTNEQLVGFIFMNGDITGQDLDEPNFGFLLEFLFAAMRPALDSYSLSKTYWALYRLSIQDHTGDRLNASKLGESIKTSAKNVIGKSCEVIVDIPPQPHSYLVCHGIIGQMIGRTLACLESAGTVTLHVTDDELWFNISLSSPKPTKPPLHQQIKLDEIAGDAPGLGLVYQFLQPNELRIRMAKDVASTNPNIHYSVSPSD
jgi:hypothetical protein